MTSRFSVQNTRRLCASLALLLASASLISCTKSPETPQENWAELRKDSAKSDEAAEVAEWMLAELLRPGGDFKKAKEARALLESIEEKGVLSSLALGLDDAEHGRAKRAADHYFDALIKARDWQDPRASLYAWFAALQVQELSDLNEKFRKKNRAHIQKLLKEPAHIGFRAYALVVDLWAEDAFSEAEEDIDAKLAEKLGCVTDVALAGPFGTNPSTDVLRSFPAEDPGVWPARFDKEPGQVIGPRQLKTEVGGCDVATDETTYAGIFYGQSFIELDEPKEVIVSSSGSTHLWINDTLVLERDVRTWGIWPKFGVKLTLAAGRHRILWKVSDAASALRVVEPNGRPVKARFSQDASLGYSLVPPTGIEDPNDLMRYIRPDGVVDPGDDLTRFIAAYMASDEGQSDVATVLFEPFVEKAEIATGISLATAATYVSSDTIYDENQKKDLIHELEVRAAEQDPGLWYPAFRNIVWEAKQKGATTIIDELEELGQRFAEVKAIHFTLAELYGDLGWGAEHERAVEKLLKTFPNDQRAIKLAIDHYENEGHTKKVNELLERLIKLNPDSEILVARALNQKRYADALKELKRLEKRRPSRKDIAARVEAILLRTGDKQGTYEQLQKAVKREPRDVHARLALADAQIATKKAGARDSTLPLADALVEAVQSGADPGLIEGAIDLIEGLTSLEPYRIDGMKVIEEYEAKNKHLDGTAARVLDYGAVWVRGDGSSRFLEHEIVRIQSDEAIKRFAEAQAYGFVLHMRVIKKDGTILEPEQVAGKPTVTMPHLEIGDYIETERIVSKWGDGVGEQYSGPGWYFREKDVAYARSEFVVIAPAHKKLVFETHNGVPDPVVEKTGSVVVTRYRVDESPAAPVEPHSPPAQEFLPRVSIGWGLDFDRRIRGISRSMIPLTANDPRVVRIAENITKGKKSRSEKLHALYHWVLESVQESEEADGRRVVVSRNGNRWRGFQTLCQALDIPVRWALAESSLASPIDGPLASAQRGLHPLLVVGTGEERVWLTIDDQFAPFGTVPSHLRGQPAYLLGSLEAVKTEVPLSDDNDGIIYKGSGSLDQNGTATLDLRLVFLGTYATSLRTGLSRIPENQLGNIIEAQLLGQELQGAQLKGYKVIDQDELDRPLIIEVQTIVPQFATPSGVGLLLSPPFMPRITQLTPLATRVTPLMITQESVTGLDLMLTLPSGYNAQVRATEGKASNSSFVVGDTAQKGSVHIKRDITTSAGRITPENYADFQKYANQADAALSAAIRLSK